MLRIHSTLQSQRRSASSPFEKLSARSQIMFCSRCMTIMREDGKHILTEKYLPWLDLAGNSRTGRNLNRSLKTQLVRILPPTLHEFLMEESQLPAFNGMGRIFWEALNISRVSINYLEIEQDNFRKKLYSVFRSRLISDVENSFITGHECVRRIMKLPDILLAGSLEKLNEFLTRYRTLEPVRTGITSAILRQLRKSDWKFDALLEWPDDSSIENFLCRSKRKRFYFWGLWRGIGMLSEEYNPVMEFMMMNRSCEVFLKYGFPYAMPERLYVKKCLLLTFTRINGLNSFDIEVYCKLVHKSNRYRMMLIFETLLALERNEPNNISNLLLVFRCVPDPYVTPSEMFSELENALPALFGNDINGICERYAAAGIHDEDYAVYKPRRLLHLSRCVVRKILADNFKLPEGIDELEIPRKLKPYLALDC